MSININWLEQKNSQPVRYIFLTFAGHYFVVQAGDVIIKTGWYMPVTETTEKLSQNCRDILQYLTDHDYPLTLNLQKQGTAFRNKVWAEICKIPVGGVMTYSQLADKLGSGARAVANACRDNPYPVIIPCHRVVSVAGLGGYMGQTEGKFMEIKKKLLASEQLIRASVSHPPP